MKKATLKDFQEHPDEMLASKEPVLITRKGKTTGVYISLEMDQMPLELRMEMLAHNAEERRKRLEARGITEEQVLADLEASRKARR